MLFCLFQLKELSFWHVSQESIVWVVLNLLKRAQDTATSWSRISGIDQQNSDLCVNGALHITTLLTIDNGPFLPTKFCKCDHTFTVHWKRRWSLINNLIFGFRRQSMLHGLPLIPVWRFYKASKSVFYRRKPYCFDRHDRESIITVLVFALANCSTNVKDICYVWVWLV